MEQDPFVRFRQVMSEAEGTGDPLPEAVALATADGEGRPTVRIMLLKGVDESGFVFFTNLESRKAGHLEANPRAALCFWWPALQNQVRVEGTVEPVGEDEADEYFATRPRGSQVGAWASKQSRPLTSHDDLIESFNRLDEKYGNNPVPRPPFWSGYRLRPERIEFWVGKADRLHERYLYTRKTDGWEITMLYP